MGGCLDRRVVFDGGELSRYMIDRIYIYAGFGICILTHLLMLCAIPLFAHPPITQAIHLNAQGEESLKALCGDDLKIASLEQVSTLTQPVLFAMMVVRQVSKPDRHSLPANVKKGDLEKLQEALDATLTAGGQPTNEQKKELDSLINQVHKMLTKGQPVLMEVTDSVDCQLPSIPKAGETMVEHVSITTMLPADIGKYLNFANDCFCRDIKTVRGILVS